MGKSKERIVEIIIEKEEKKNYVESHDNLKFDSCFAVSSLVNLISMPLRAASLY